MSNNKVIGSTLIVIGTTMGAGMLALPIISAKTGFISAIALLIVIWLLMSITSLLTLEVNLAFPEYANSLGTMALKTLGIPGQIICWLCTLLLLYSLTAAYITGSSSLLANVLELIWHIKTPPWFTALLFVVSMGGMIFWSAQSTDYCNRFFLGIKGILLISTLAILFPQINWVNLAPHFNYSSTYFWNMIPIFACSFGFHTVIPSLSIYIGRQPQTLKKILIYGSSTTLIIYLLWLSVTMGIVPSHGANSFATIQSNNVGEFVKIIYVIANNKWVTAGVNLFSNIAMTTSFLGVALGLFDFLADGFKRPNTRFGRLQTSGLTFIPPIAFALFFPQGFILALQYASFFVIVLLIIFPALMAYNLRKKNNLPSLYQVFGGQYLLAFIIASGILMLSIQIFSSLGML